jgi:hypothetical protein
MFDVQPSLAIPLKPRQSTYSAAELISLADALRDNGYVVIPKERHVVLTVQRSLGWMDYDHLSKDAEGWKRFNQYIDERVAREIGTAMLHKNAITKTELGWREHYTRLATEYQAGIILPEA